MGWLVCDHILRASALWSGNYEIVTMERTLSPLSDRVSTRKNQGMQQTLDRPAVKGKVEDSGSD